MYNAAIELYFKLKQEHVTVPNETGTCDKSKYRMHNSNVSPQAMLSLRCVGTTFLVAQVTFLQMALLVPHQVRMRFEAKKNCKKVVEIKEKILVGSMNCEEHLSYTFKHGKIQGVFRK